MSLYSGASCLVSGLQLILRPELRRFVMFPLLINLLLFIGLIVLCSHYFEIWLNALLPSLPYWLGWLNFILWPIFIALLGMMLFFGFSVVCTLIAAPFNGLLAERTELLLRNSVASTPQPGLLELIPRSLGRELRKLGYLLPRAIGLLVLSFIPGLNLIAAPLWLLLGVWMMAVQYIDYPADNNLYSWDNMLDWLRQRRASSLGFGVAAYAALLLPGLNILLMPAAVCGATALWVKEG